MKTGNRFDRASAIASAARTMSLRKTAGLVAFACWVALPSLSFPARAGDVIRTKSDASRCDAVFRKGKLAVDCPNQMAGVMFLKITRATNIEFSVPSKIARTRASVVLPEMPLREAVVRLLEPYNFVWTEHDSQETPFPSVAILGTKQLTADSPDFERRWNQPIEASGTRDAPSALMEMEEPGQPRPGRQTRSGPVLPPTDGQRAEEKEAEVASSGLSFSSAPSGPGLSGSASPSPARETSTPPQARDNPNGTPSVDPSVAEEHPLPGSAQN